MYYTHLSGLEEKIMKGRNEKKEIRVEQGELLGYSGLGNNNAHLHITLFRYDSQGKEYYMPPSDLQKLFGSQNGDKWVAGK